MRNTKKAFIWITNILENKGIKYKISGGFSARLYGVNRELADIDIEIKNKDMISILQDVKPYLIFEPGRYVDEHWDLYLLTLNYEGQEIDIAEVEAKIFNYQNQKWEDKNIVEKWMDSDNFEIKEVFGKKVLVESVKCLLEYKSKLLREVDIEDINQLRELN